MAQRSCSCCNRKFDTLKLKLHAVRSGTQGCFVLQNNDPGLHLSSCTSFVQVGGGVRGENELLCVDCWAIFASEAWEDAAAPLQGPTDNDTAQSQHVSSIQAPAGNGNQAGNSHAAAHAQPAADTAPQQQQALSSRTESLGVIKRLSGGGEWQRPVRILSKESLGSARPQEVAGEPEEAVPTNDNSLPARPEGGRGPVLKRDRSGRFVSPRAVQAAAAAVAAAYDDPLMQQDLLSSQAHLFEEQPQPGELACKVLPAYPYLCQTLFMGSPETKRSLQCNDSNAPTATGQVAHGFGFG